METRDQRYMRYLSQNKGFWFASCPDMNDWAKDKVSEGVLRSLSEIIPGRPETNYWYVESRISSVEQLLEYFTGTGLYQLFGIYDYCVDYQI